VCPFVDSADPQCATHLTLRNIVRAFLHCADRYAECPIYRRLMTESRTHAPADSRVPIFASS